MVAQEREKRMSKKNIGKRLNNIGFSLYRDIFGWIVIDDSTKFERRFSTLGGVVRFVTDEEAMAAYVAKNRA
jgi:hypothetical protein